MSEDSDSQSEEEQRLFRPFTRESRAAIELRIAQENEKFKELEKKRAEGEVQFTFYHFLLLNLLELSRVPSPKARVRLAYGTNSISDSELPFLILHSLFYSREESRRIESDKI